MRIDIHADICITKATVGSFADVALITPESNAIPAEIRSKISGHVGLGGYDVRSGGSSVERHYMSWGKSRACVALLMGVRGAEYDPRRGADQEVS
eukprot:1054197-Pyramimonas_sp.AAC.1